MLLAELLAELRTEFLAELRAELLAELLAELHTELLAKLRVELAEPLVKPLTQSWPVLYLTKSPLSYNNSSLKPDSIINFTSYQSFTRGSARGPTRSSTKGPARSSARSSAEALYEAPQRLFTKLCRGSLQSSLKTLPKLCIELY